MAKKRKKRRSKARRKNPGRRTRTVYKTKYRTRARRSRRRYSRRRNPGVKLGGLQLQPILFGALGAIAVDMVMARLPIPAKMKGAAQIGIGALLSSGMIKPLKHPVFKFGGLVVAALGVKNLIQQNVPQLAGDDLTPEEQEALAYYANEMNGDDEDFTDYSDSDDGMMGENIEMGSNIEFGEDEYDYDDELEDLD